MRSLRNLVGRSLIAGLVGVGGCGDVVVNRKGLVCDNGVGCANPASVYCVEQGGNLRAEENEAGQYAICELPDGREVEEWRFFYEDYVIPNGLVDVEEWRGYCERHPESERVLCEILRE